MRKQIVAGNWKMNLVAKEVNDLAKSIEKFAIYNSMDDHTEVILAPPYVYLEAMVDRMQLFPNFHIAAQNCHHEVKGAFTGEVSAPMLQSIGVEYLIIGHSERRAQYNESNEMLKQKVNIALENGLRPIFCCGEQDSVREAGQHKNFVDQQLSESLFHLNSDEIEQCVIAYEPIWAIGTGKTASPEQAQEMHQFIRFLVQHKYGELIAADMSILYGGSCKPTNAVSLFSQKDVDGGLIGGASLTAEQFIPIIEAF